MDIALGTVPLGDAAKPAPRGVIRAAAVALLVALGIALSAPYYPERFSDFRAFYCAGRAVLEGADPYRAHPLTECERSVRAPALSRLRDGVAVPAPFPGYVLALFALMALLPFGWALGLWTAAACGATGVATWLLARLTATPPAAAAIVIAFPAATVALPLGQLTPFVLLAIVGAACLLQAGRRRAASLAALGALLDPHVGVALALGLFAAVPRTRLTLVMGVAALVALGLTVSGPQHEWEYVSAVLPAHALANVADSWQFSATNFAYVAGLPARAAFAVGSIWYAAALTVGIGIAVRLRSRLGIAAAALIPPAFAVFGGTHTHLAQLALAVPAFLLAVSNARGKQRDVLAIVTFVAATPWLLIGPFPLLFPAAAVLGVAYARSMNCARGAPALGAASLATLALIFIGIVHANAPRAGFDARISGNPLAEAAWQIAVLARNSPPDSWCIFAKGPTVIAFLALFAALIGAARRGAAREC